MTQPMQELTPVKAVDLRRDLSDGWYQYLEDIQELRSRLRDAEGEERKELEDFFSDLDFVPEEQLWFKEDAPEVWLIDE